jgi:hypothetical protein
MPRFVVLDGLCSRDDSDAGLALRLFLDDRKHLLEPFDVPFGLSTGSPPASLGHGR